MEKLTIKKYIKRTSFIRDEEMRNIFFDVEEKINEIVDKINSFDVIDFEPIDFETYKLPENKPFRVKPITEAKASGYPLEELETVAALLRKNNITPQDLKNISENLDAAYKIVQDEIKNSARLVFEKEK